jgi:D-arabinonate dehydratase/D-galactarolactone cycloisomerase
MPFISRLSVHTHCNDLGGKVWNPAIKWTRKYAVFIVIETSDGVTGLGECWCFDTAPDSLVAFIRTELAPHVVGQDIEHHATMLHTLWSRATLSARHGILASALSGVDIALWDLRSRRAALPLWRYLNNALQAPTNSNGQVYLYGSGGLYGQDKTTADLAEEMTSIQAHGFNIVKMKVGALTAKDDLARVHAVLAELPNNCKIIIDGVYSYTAEDALRFYTALPTSRIAAFQSPTPADNIAGMRHLNASGVPVLAVEAEYREELHSTLIQQNAVRYLQVAPIACGGISRLHQLSGNCASAQIPLSLEVSSTAVALLAGCHFAAADTQVAHTEYHFIHQVFFNELNLTPISSKPGWFQLPDTPGLGLKLPLSDTHKEFEATQ